MNRFMQEILRAEMWVRRRTSRDFRVQVQRPLQKHGSDYGGWVIDPTDLDMHSVVYSFGIGDDVSFDLSMIQTFGCQIYAFDPTPKSVAWVTGQDLPPQFHFYEYGIAAYDGEAAFSPPFNPDHVSYRLLPGDDNARGAIQAPVYRLQTIMDQLGHHHIDLLKMDVEGAEYGVLQQITQEQLEIDQLLVEFHHRFDSVGWRQTHTAIDWLNRCGFEKFYISQSGDDFSFIRNKI